MCRITSEKTPKRRIDNDGNLLQYLKSIEKAKKEGKKMNLNVIKHGMTIAGIAMVLTMILCTIFVFLDKEPKIIVEIFRIFIMLIGAAGLGLFGILKTTND